MATTGRKAPRKLVADVDALGKLRAEMAILKAAERELSIAVQKMMEDGSLQAVEGKVYSATLAVRETRKIAPGKLAKVLTPAKYADCLRVDLRTARKHLSAPQYDRLAAVVSTGFTLRVSKR